MPPRRSHDPGAPAPRGALGRSDPVPPDHLRVREASVSDIGTVSSLYCDLNDGDEPADPATIAAAGRALSELPGAHLFVAETGGDPVSTCVLFVLPNLSRGARPFGLVENVVTRRDRRNRGYAAALLEHVLAFAWGAGCYKVMLLTGRSDPSVHRLYRKVGFLPGAKAGYVAYPPEGPP
ncbi:MAG: GNAT family N-acetyltransferase [Methanospirillum sp.]|nr:GNAT family N-acetyltransferase [Methanospirillum sp.]